MSRSAEQKIRLLVLYDILHKETDAEHQLSTNELIERLASYGIQATRQTVYDDIEMLNSFGYEIITVHGRNNRYFVGDRTFELPEVQVLLHAVGAAKFLTEKKASVLTEKVAELLGEAQADSLKELLTVKSNELGNERVYYSIDAITTALIEKRKLSFLYFDYDSRGNRIYRKEGDRYEVNPLGMVYSGENFYLVCFHDKYDNPASYRIDKILGYERVGDTYVINPEQAETVRMIYDLYLKGYGFTKIAHELTKLKRRDASGTIKWDCTKVSRALHNATYMGYKCYLKSYRNNYLDQKSIVNRDESTHLYVKGDFEPIIPEETWYRCKEIRENRRIERGVKAGKRIITGVRPCNDVWVKKTVCKCGCHFRKDKWHRNKNGVTYGYKCYNVLNNGSRSSRINDGIEELDGFCDMGTIAGWKFDLMAYEIFRKLTLDFDSLLDEVYSNYVKNDTSEAKDAKAEIKRLTGVIQKEKMKLDNLTTMRMEGEITKEEYLDYKVKVTANIETTQKRIDKLQQEDLTTQGNSEHQFSKEELGGMLRIELDFTQPIVKRGIIDAFVRKIVAHSALEFDWYLNLVPHAADSGFKEVTSFTIEYESAHSYREMRAEILRKYQYKNIVVHIYA